MVDATSGIAALPAAPADPVRPVQRQSLQQQGKPDNAAPQRVLETVEAAMRQVTPAVMGQNERLSISRDEATGTFIYRSIDRESGEVVRQWPVESMLQFKA